MRLWHKDLISVLPRQQLLGQWRECCLIAKNIAEKGTPNHLLVNRIMDYPIEHFISYGKYIFEEMKDRGYKCDWISFEKWLPYRTECQYPISKYVLFSTWHNDRYLTQCLFNLQEKYDCGGIPKEEWEKIGRYMEIKFMDDYIKRKM